MLYMSKPKCSEHVVPEAPPVTQAHSSDARMLFAARTALSLAKAKPWNKPVVFAGIIARPAT